MTSIALITNILWGFWGYIVEKCTCFVFQMYIMKGWICWAFRIPDDVFCQEMVLEWDTTRGNVLFYYDILSIVLKTHWAASSLDNDVQLMFPCSGKKENIRSQMVTTLVFCSWVKATLEWDRADFFLKKAQIVSFTEWLPGWLKISGNVFTVKQSVGENAERVDLGTGETTEFSLILFPLLPRSRSFQVNTKQENNQIKGLLHWLWGHSWVSPKCADPKSAMSCLLLQNVAKLGNL